jgi:hypothetical protein
MYEDIFNWLRAETARRQLTATIYEAAARRIDGYLKIPVYLDNAGDAYDKATQLTEIEEKWNDQEPRPEIRMFLLPGARP